MPYVSFNIGSNKEWRYLIFDSPFYLAINSGILAIGPGLYNDVICIKSSIHVGFN